MPRLRDDLYLRLRRSWEKIHQYNIHRKVKILKSDENISDEEQRNRKLGGRKNE